MKNLTLLLTFLIASISFGQVTFSDNLSWISPTATSSDDSDVFSFCNNTKVGYTISTTTSSTSSSQFPSDFRIAQNNTPGMIIPAFPPTNPVSAMDFQIEFTQEVCNVRIHFVDFDENVSGSQSATVAEEYLTNISPACSGVTATAGSLYPNVFPSTVVTPYDNDIATSNDNTNGWVEWNQPITALSFTLNRPGAGWGVIIDAIEFECCQPVISCACDAQFQLSNPGQPNSDGVQNAGLNIDTQGELVTSVVINLPSFVSQVDDECLKCSDEVESYGTFTSATPIAGVNATLVDPYGLGYSRKIRYDFPTPIALNDLIEIEMQFPPVLDLACCQNDVDYCYDISLRKDDCTSCDYTVCSDQDIINDDSNQEFIQSESKYTNTNTYNDFVVDERMVISPNPATNQVTIEFNSINITNAVVVVYDVMGKVLLKRTVKDSSTTLDVSALSSGSYLVSINGDNVQMTKTLIIK